jgi:hypothetical protein
MFQTRDHQKSGLSRKRHIQFERGTSETRKTSLLWGWDLDQQPDGWRLLRSTYSTINGPGILGFWGRKSESSTLKATINPSAPATADRHNLPHRYRSVQHKLKSKTIKICRRSCLGDRKLEAQEAINRPNIKISGPIDSLYSVGHDAVPFQKCLCGPPNSRPWELHLHLEADAASPLLSLIVRKWKAHQRDTVRTKHFWSASTNAIIPSAVNVFKVRLA